MTGEPTLPELVRSRPRAASLCMGYGGLDLALESLLDIDLAWCSEIDANASRIIDRRWPGVPNLGDLKAIDWTAVAPVDVLTAGYPCQPFSHAGRRQGTDDERHLWPYIADAVRLVRPRLVVLENVAGHLSLGLDTVTADLARMGYVGRHGVVRASDVGACHQRARVFIVAADAENFGCEWVGSTWRGRTRPEDRRGAPAHACGQRGGWDAGAAPRAQEQARRWAADEGDGAVAVRQDAADADSGRLQERGEPHRRQGEPGLAASRRGDADGRRTDDADADRSGPQGSEPAAGHVVPSWGDYGPAIERHARVLGRPAPGPVDDVGRLSPRFVEWMMMLPDGWVTDVLANRTASLKALGNGVVPPQAELGVGTLLAGVAARVEVAA